MRTERVQMDVQVYDDAAALNEKDRMLLDAARRETANAYAPYSNFRVGAAALLSNGEIVKGSNQENASFPAGICAERALLSTAATLFPGMPIDTLAVSYHNLNGGSDKPISPCGICRQSIHEFQSRTSGVIRVILGGLQGEVFVIENAKDLLPLVFGSEDMK